VIEAQVAVTERQWEPGGESIRLVRLVPTTKQHTPELDSPMKILWARVILRALYDYVIWKDSDKLKDRRDFQTVKKWLFEPSALGNSLENLCRLLGWPTHLIREKALTMTREDVKKMEFREREQTLRALDDGKSQ
jgi:hypothetical protein